MSRKLAFFCSIFRVNAIRCLTCDMHTESSIRHKLLSHVILVQNIRLYDILRNANYDVLLVYQVDDLKQKTGLQ